VAQAARSRGAVSSNKLRALEGRRAKLDTPAALVGFTGKLIQELLDGTTPVDVGRAVLYGIGIQRQLVESSELERRIAAIEQRLQGPRDRWPA
jgi:hypothetical protein